MIRPRTQPVWKAAPFIRLLFPLIVGIILQRYLQLSIPVILVALVSFLLSYSMAGILPLAVRFKMHYLQGVLLFLLIAGFGCFISWHKDNRNQEAWYGNRYTQGDHIIVKIEEPPVERAKTFRTVGTVESVLHGNTVIPCIGKLMLYFSKDSNLIPLHYGDRIMISKTPEPIKNSGNPGAFDYVQYAAFQGYFHQLFLREPDWVKLDSSSINALGNFILSSRQSIVQTLKNHLPAKTEETGLAEALLIGYTNDLDKDLVQAYTHAGVVHIIAISGMHLALIYMMLEWLFARIPGIKKVSIVRLITVLVCLWLFSLITGAAASVLRAAVMFSFISVGRHIGRNSTTFNSLASSAFVLLCYNPYYLWDVGFQLSYLAVAGILIFQRPLYQSIRLKRKPLDEIWKLVSVSLAAELLTLPICLYYFHQFPLLFLPANVIAVPLSGIILYAEIALLALSALPYIASFVGLITDRLLWLMNKAIIWIDQFSFSVWDNIPATLLSTGLLYAIILTFSASLLNKSKRWFFWGLGFMLSFVINNAAYNWRVTQQKKLIVYNINHHQAMDLVSGGKYLFRGDSVLKKDQPLSNTQLKPCRIALGLNKELLSMGTVFQTGSFIQFMNTRIFLANEPLMFDRVPEKISMDLIIVSGNPGLTISQLASVFNAGLFVFDASNSLWKIGKWKAECSMLHLPCYSVPENGAFIKDL